MYVDDLELLTSGEEYLTNCEDIVNGLVARGSARMLRTGECHFVYNDQPSFARMATVGDLEKIVTRELRLDRCSADEPVLVGELYVSIIWPQSHGIDPAHEAFWRLRQVQVPSLNIREGGYIIEAIYRRKRFFEPFSKQRMMRHDVAPRHAADWDEALKNGLRLEMAMAMQRSLGMSGVGSAK